MKKTLILAIIAFLANSTFAQTATLQKDKEKVKSNIETFSERSGTLLKKDFINVGTMGKVEVEVLVISDLVNGSSNAGLRLSYESYSSTLGSDTKIAFIDKDEVDGLLKSLYLIRDKILQTKPENYQEVYFTSRSGFQAGCFPDKKGKWNLFMKLEKYDSRSNVYFDDSDLAQIITTIEKGKQKL